MLKFVRTEKRAINNTSLVKLKHCGFVKSIIYTSRANHNCYIKKINNNEYIDLRSGEILNYEHIKNRSQSIPSLKRTFKLMRDLINTNCYNTKKVKFITLTYAENMTDTKRLYQDFRKFYLKFKYHFESVKDYISIIEPQERGAWHLHIFFIFNDNAPKIDFKFLKDLWGYGRIKIQNIDNVDNLGAYLTAYLSDIEITDNEIVNLKNKFGDNVIIDYVEKEITNYDNTKDSKKFIKGGRLHMYPPKMQIVRYSKGIKKPTIDLLEYEQAIKKIGCSNREPIFSKTLMLSNESTDFKSIFIQEDYNTSSLFSQIND